MPAPIMSAALCDLLGDQHDTGAHTAVAFLHDMTADWRPDWWLNLCAIWPDGERGLAGRSWRVSDLAQRKTEIATQIAAWNRAGAGCYFGTDPLHREVNTRAKASDVAAITQLAADIDPDVASAGGFDAARVALRAAMDAAQSGAIGPRWVIDTGHGAGLFAPLAEPMDPASGLAARQGWQARLRADLIGVSVDRTADAGRLMRLPGPYNWPKATKVARGYPEAGTRTALRSRRAGVAVPPDLAATLAAEAGTGGGERPDVTLAALLAPSDALLAEAIEHLPCPPGDRDSWIATLHALKGAGATEEQALAWSDRWDGPPEDPDDFARRWEGICPTAAGWPQIERAARAAGWYGSVAHDFGPVLAQLRQQAEAAASAGRFGNLRLRTVADAEHAPPRDYLAKPLLARGEFSVWWGAPKTGKSFLVLSAAWHIAMGRDFFGFKVRRPARVLYVAAEGEGGFNGRVQALRREIGDPGDYFCFIAQPVSVGPPGADLPALIDAARAVRAELLVLDTVARVFGEGDENTAQDMGGFVSACDRLRDATGAHVLAIHHGRKDKGDLRGSSALSGAADLIVKIEKGQGQDPSTATIEAAKDDADGRSLAFRLRRSFLGLDADGDPIETCLAEQATAPAKSESGFSKAAAAVLAVIGDLLTAEGEAPAGLDTGDALAIRDSRLRAECEARHVSTAAKPDSRARMIREAVSNLRDTGRIGMRDGWIWLRALDVPPRP